MTIMEFILRLFIGLAVLIFGIIVWALAPYLAGVHIPDSGADFHAPVLSIFFGTNTPAPAAILGFLLARATFAMAVFSWIVIPAARYFFYNIDFRPLARAGVILFMSLSVAAFLGALLWHYIFHT